MCMLYLSDSLDPAVPTFGSESRADPEPTYDSGTIIRMKNDCLDRLNRTIPEYSTFLPVEDPCVECTCLKAKPVKCQVWHCPTPSPSVSTSL
jgi:hypothetical protein